MSNKTFLTWDNIQEDCKLLADKLSDINFTCIIGIANGGMIPATLLAKHLKVDKLLSANLKSYQEDKPRNGAHTTEDIVKVISFPSWVVAPTKVNLFKFNIMLRAFGPLSSIISME